MAPRRWRCLLGVALLGSTGCVPVVLPPGRVESSEGLRLGASPPRDARTPSATASKGETRVAAGVHLASILPSTPVDAGIGYVLTDVGLGDREVHGAYAEIGPFLRSTNELRLFLGARGEAMFGGGLSGYGLYGRIAGEVHTSTMGDSWDNRLGGGAVAGTTGFGWFIDSGWQVLPGSERATIVAAGLWLRFPAVAGLVCCVPPRAFGKALLGFGNAVSK